MTTPITITSESKEAEVDRSLVKIILLGVLSVGLSFLATHLFKVFLGTMLPLDFLLWFVTSVAFLIVAVLEVVFIKSSGKLTFLMCLNGFIPLTLFLEELFPNPAIPLLAGGALAILFLIIGAQRGWNILAEGMTIRFGLAVRNMLPKAVTGILIFLCAATYVSYFQLHQFTPTAGKNLFEASLVYAEPVVRIWFPGTSLNATAGDFFKQVATSEIANIPTSELSNITGGAALNFGALPAAVKERVIIEAGVRIQQAFADTYGTVRADEPIKDVFFRLIKKYADEASTNMGSAFAVFVAVLLFFALRGFFSLILWFIVFLSFLVYKFLVIVGFAYVSVESRSREFVILS